MVANGLLGLSRLSNRKDIKVILPFETNTKSLKESPDFPSTTEHRSPQERPSVHSQRSEWSAPNVHTCFPFIGSVTSRSRATSERSGLNGRKVSDWLRPESTARVRISSQVDCSIQRTILIFLPACRECRRSWQESRWSCRCTTYMCNNTEINNILLRK